MPTAHQQLWQQTVQIPLSQPSPQLEEVEVVTHQRESAAVQVVAVVGMAATLRAVLAQLVKGMRAVLVQPQTNLVAAAVVLVVLAQPQLGQPQVTVVLAYQAASQVHPLLVAAAAAAADTLRAQRAVQQQQAEQQVEPTQIRMVQTPQQTLVAEVVAQ